MRRPHVVGPPSPSYTPLPAVDLRPEPPRPCSYLPQETAAHLAFRAARLPPGVYQVLMDLNFRRSGQVFYRPACPACNQCRALRIPLAEFRPNRSQRRCQARNRDLQVSLGVPQPTAEKQALYERYLRQRHPGGMDASWESFTDFLYWSVVNTVEVSYRLGGELVMVGIADLEPEALSTVYCFFEPRLAGRSLGTFNILWAIDHARSLDMSYVYLGYYIRDCGKMSYKAGFRPCEILQPDGRWRRLDRR